METGAGLVKSGIAASLKRFGGAALDLLYPPVCLSCDAPVATADALCADCFRKLRPISAPMCPVLGIPFEVSLGPEARSAEAIADPPPFDRSRSAVVYNEVARSLVGEGVAPASIEQAGSQAGAGAATRPRHRHWASRACRTPGIARYGTSS